MASVGGSRLRGVARSPHLIAKARHHDTGGSGTAREVSRTGFVGVCVLPVEQFYDESTTEALIKMEVACRLALESLPKIPSESEEALRKPVQTLCKVTERELKRLRPDCAARRTLS
jgi:hypothetical protein